MGTDVFEITINVVKMLVIFLMMVQIVPVLVWVERRGSAFIQNRLGPNRIGPLGLTQLLADAVKFIFKEDFRPAKARAALYYAAPVMAMIPGAVAFGAIPLSMPMSIEAFTMLGSTWGPYHFDFQTFNLGIGLVFVLGISSLAGYGILMAGYGSQNKYSMTGALRASAQMISYELALGLSLVGIILLYGTFDFQEMILKQAGPLSFTWAGKETVLGFLPNWGIFYQPIGFILYFCAIFAETNRTPFDLPEAEGELVAGYHTEYGGLKMNMFYIGEYGHMLVGSALATVLFFGGYLIPGLPPESIISFLANNGCSPNVATVLTAFLLHGVFLVKVLIFLWVFIWVRWTIPRFRYDQLMDLGWKTMLPWALANVIATAVIMTLVRM